MYDQFNSPNTQGLFAEGFEVACERGRIVTDENFRTSVDSIYAIGDVTSKIQLAHMASAQGICAVHTIAGQKPPIDLRYVPGCIYTDPEIASVGITEDEAKQQGIPVKKGKFLMTGNGRSLIDEQPDPSRPPYAAGQPDLYIPQTHLYNHSKPGFSGNCNSPQLPSAH